MKLTVQVKLLPTLEQHDALLQTLERANEAAQYISNYAWETRVFRQYDLHRALYYDLRERFQLSAQIVVRVLARVADAYKLDRRVRRVFNRHGAISYDDRILKYYSDSASIWTLAGRQRMPFACGDKQRMLLAYRQGESDLVYRDGKWYLLATVDYIEPPEGEASDVLGVDLGIANIAADSDGDTFSGGQVNALRKRHAKLRARMQSKGTRAARRLLNKRKRKEQRFATWVNHNISKRVVLKAQRTNRGIALEDLQGIRSRVRVRKSQRRQHHSWAFAQLRSFIEYKAKLAGVVVALVDPRNTSRTCPSCGYVAKANRKTQALFSCVQCAFAGPADTIAAQNIRALGRAAVSQPHFSVAIG